MSDARTELLALWTELAATTKGYRQMAQPLAPGTHWYAARQHYDAALAALPVTPAPTPPPTILDDKRAVHMTAISSVGAVVNPDGTSNGQPDSVIVRSQSPAGFWSSLIYTNDDVTFVQDPRYGQVYRFRTNGQSRNPYWSSPTTCNTELVWDRPLTIGQTDWYAFATKHEPSWDYANVVDWHSLFQFCYPTISSPPVALMAGYGDNIFIQRCGGLVTNSTAADISYYGVQGATVGPFLKQSSVQGHWLEHLIGIKWGSNKDGEIHYATRCKDLGESGFTDRVNATGVTTWQWGATPTFTVPQDPNLYRVNDKLDSYYGYKPGVSEASVPTNYLQHTGHVRCATKADALAVAG